MAMRKIYVAPFAEEVNIEAESILAMSVFESEVDSTVEQRSNGWMEF